MTEKSSEFRQLGGDVPEMLIERFDAMCERLGLVKKRALAAAVAAMIDAEVDQQMKWYRDVYVNYYSLAQDIADGIAEDENRTSRPSPPVSNKKVNDLGAGAAIDALHQKKPSPGEAKKRTVG